MFSGLAEAKLQTAPLSLVLLVQPCTVTQKKMTSYAWGKDEAYSLHGGIVLLEVPVTVDGAQSFISGDEVISINMVTSAPAHLIRNGRKRKITKQDEGRCW